MKIMNKEIGKEEVIMFIKSGLIVYFLFFPVLLLVVSSELFLIFGLLGLLSWVVSVYDYVREHKTALPLISFMFFLMIILTLHQALSLFVLTYTTGVFDTFTTYEQFTTMMLVSIIIFCYAVVSKYYYDYYKKMLEVTIEGME
jgi:hypothetical protein